MSTDIGESVLFSLLLPRHYQPPLVSRFFNLNIKINKSSMTARIRSNPPLSMPLTDTIYVNPAYDTVEESFVMYSRTPQGFFSVHKEWVRLFGIISAVVLANYVEKYKYFKEHYPENDGWFFLRYEDIAAELGITEHIIRKAKQQLIDTKVLEIRICGLPKKEWLLINFKTLNALDTNGCSRPENSECLDIKNFNVLDLKILMSINKNKELKRTKIQKKLYKKSFENSNSNQPQIEITPLTKQLISPSLFEKFWKLYPRKVNKPGAEKSFHKVCGQKDRPTWGALKTALLKQIQSDQWKDKQYIPHPTTWLNQQRWDEDVPEKPVRYTRTNFHMNENPAIDPIKQHDYEI